MLQIKIIETDQLGILSLVLLQQMNTSKTKRERKTAFAGLSRLIQLSKLVPAPSVYLYLSEGMSASGTSVIICLYQMKETQNDLKYL